MAATETQWHRLGRYVRDRREDLGYTQSDLNGAGGPSIASVVLIENAKRTSYKPQTIKRLETSLGWARGSVRDILAGGEPTDAPIGERDATVDTAASSKTVRLRGVLDELDNLSPAELSALAIRAVELIAEAKE